MRNFGEHNWGISASGSTDADRLTRWVQVPNPRSSLEEIWAFALTLDGYGRFGQGLDEMANAALERWVDAGVLAETVLDLRRALFFEQRRWRHFGDDPVGRDAHYIGGLVEAIHHRSDGWVEDQRPISL